MKKKYILPIALLALCAVLLAAGIVLAQGDFEEMTGWQRTLYAIINRDEILNTKFVGEVSEDTWTAEEEYKLENTAVVQKTPGEDFVVMNVADLHMSDYTQDAVTNFRNLENIRRKVEELQPDLITLSGDLVWKDSTVYSIQRITEFMDSLEIPWAPIFGNHDHEGNADLNYLADLMMQGKYCLMQKGDAAMGVGNYIVNICEGERIVHSILLFDSHTNGKLSEDQVAWYKWAIEGVQGIAGENVPSSLVLHMPIAQYQYAYDEAWNGEDWKDGYGAYGFKRENVDCARDENDEPLDTGLFDHIKGLGSTTNIICGHEHANCFSIEYQGVRLTYSMRLGYGAYFEFDQQGVTTLTIGSDGSGTVAHHYLYPYDVEFPQE